MEKNNVTKLGYTLLFQLVLQISVRFILPSILPYGFVGSTSFKLLGKLTVFLLPIIFYFKQTGYNPLVSSGKKKNISPAGWGARYLFGLGTTVFVVNIIGFLTTLVSGNSKAAVFENIGDAVTSLVLSVVLAAILEETLFRGAVFHATEGQSMTVRLLFGAVLFALMHLSLSQFFYALAAGAVISLFYIENGSLMFAAALHVGSNFVTWIFTAVRSFCEVTTETSEIIVLTVSAILTVAGAVIWVIKRKKTPVKTDVGEFYISQGLSIYIILALAISIVL